MSRTSSRQIRPGGWTKIQLFGRGWLTHSRRYKISVPSAFWPLVGFLVSMPGQRASRGRIAGELWPENDELAARHCLASALWRIRAALPPGTMIFQAQGDWLTLANDVHIWIDAVSFQRRVALALKEPERLAVPQERHRLLRALGLYRSEFLRECHLPWAAIERERLRTLYLDGLYELAIAQSRCHNWTATMQVAKTLCQAEPLREDAQRLLMTAYARCGNRALALKQYHRCEAALRDELGVAPMAETAALFGNILHDFGPESPPDSGQLGDLVKTRDELLVLLSRIDARIVETGAALGAK